MVNDIILRHVRWYYYPEEMKGIIFVKYNPAADWLQIGSMGTTALPVQLLLPILNAALPEDWMAEAEKLHRGRKYPWTVITRKGLSGCRDYKLYFLKDEEVLDQRLAAVVHVSMYDKLNEGLRLWLGDFPPILAALLEDFPPAKEEEDYLLEVYTPSLRGEYKHPGAGSGLQEAIESLKALEVMSE